MAMKTFRGCIIATLFCAILIAAGCGGGGGGGGIVSPGGGVTPTGGNKLSGRISEGGAAREAGREAEAVTYPQGRSVRLYKINNKGEYTRDGINAVQDAVTGVDGKFSFTGVPSGMTDLVVQCTNCATPAAVYVHEVATTGESDVGIVSQESYAEQKVLKELLVKWSDPASAPPGTTAPREPGDVNFNEIKAMITSADVSKLVDAAAPNTSKPELTALVNGIKEKRDIEETTMQSLGENQDANMKKVQALLEDLYSQLKDGKIANLGDLEKVLATKLKEMEAAGTLPAGFAQKFLEARSKGYEIFNNNIGTASGLAIAGQATGAVKDVEFEKFKQRCEEQRERLAAIFDRLINLASSVPGAAGINKTSLLAEIDAAEKNFIAAASVATTSDDVKQAFEKFNTTLRDIFNRVINSLGISKETFTAILQDIRDQEAQFTNRIKDCKNETDYKTALDNFQSKTDSILNGIKYLLIQAFPDVNQKNPEKIEELTRILKDFIRLIALRDTPLPPSVIGPPPGGDTTQFSQLVIEPNFSELKVGDKVQFKAFGITSNGARTELQKVMWSTELPNKSDGTMDCPVPAATAVNSSNGAGMPMPCAPQFGYIDPQGVFYAKSPGTGVIAAALELFSPAAGNASASNVPGKILTAYAKVKISSSTPGGEALTGLVIEPSKIDPVSIGKSVKFKAVGVTKSGAKVDVYPVWYVVSDKITVDQTTWDSNTDCGGVKTGARQAPRTSGASAGSDSTTGGGSGTTTPGCIMPPWTTNPPIGYIDNDGTFHATAPGTGKVVAEIPTDGLQPAISSSVPVQVKSAGKIYIDPHYPKDLKVGDNLLFKAYAIMDDGTKQPLDKVAWHTEALVDGKPIKCWDSNGGATPSSTDPSQDTTKCIPGGFIDDMGAFYAQYAGKVLVVATLPSFGENTVAVQDSVIITITEDIKVKTGVNLLPVPGSFHVEPMPTDGAAVTLSVKVINNGPDTATNVKVTFTDNANGMLDVVVPIETITIASLAANTTAIVKTTKWKTAGQVGDNMIFVEVSSDQKENYPYDNRDGYFVHVGCPTGKIMGADGACTSDFSKVYTEFHISEIVSDAANSVVRKETHIDGEGRIIVKTPTGALCGNMEKTKVQSLAKDLYTNGFFEIFNPPTMDPTTGPIPKKFSFFMSLADMANTLEFNDGGVPDKIAAQWKELRTLTAESALTAAACNSTGGPPPATQKCPDQRPQICTQDYSPACGSDGFTYGNGCYACTNKNVAWFTPGACPK